jgi:hypothetical protein
MTTMSTSSGQRHPRRGANSLHIARLTVGACLLAMVGIAGCNFYDDDGVPRPSSTWTFVCDDDSIAPDAGCPMADGGTADDGGGGGGGDDDSRQAR